MHAAVVEQFGKPLSLVELNIPSPGPGEILVKTEACGVCHTDLHAMHGDWPVKPTLPFIPGHEAIGLVAAVGSGVKIVKEGDRVGVPLALLSVRSLRILFDWLGNGLRSGPVRRLQR
jgi:propanol-preferring alcohol dehydrogenase